MQGKGHSLIKVCTDVPQVQNLCQAEFLKKNLMTKQVFVNFGVQKLKFFS